jgi:hypothetical protein
MAIPEAFSGFSLKCEINWRASRPGIYFRHFAPIEISGLSEKVFLGRPSLQLDRQPPGKKRE